MTGPAPLPDLVLYRRDGCHLCDETRATLELLFARRAREGLAVPRLVERDIDDNPALQHAMFETVPVLQLGARRLPLAIRVAAIRAFLAESLEAADRPPGGAEPA